MLGPLLPAIHGDVAKAALALEIVLLVLQEGEIGLPAIPLLAVVKLVEVLPQMILAGKGTFRGRPLGAGLKLVGLNVVVGGRGLAAKDALRAGVVDAPDEKGLVGWEGHAADPGIEAGEVDGALVTDPVVAFSKALEAKSALKGVALSAATHGWALVAGRVSVDRVVGGKGKKGHVAGLGGAGEAVGGVSFVGSSTIAAYRLAAARRDGAVASAAVAAKIFGASLGGAVEGILNSRGRGGFVVWRRVSPALERSQCV